MRRLRGPALAVARPRLRARGAAGSNATRRLRRDGRRVRASADGAVASRPLRDQRGQAAIELVALLPLVALVAVAMLQALAAGAAVELAGHAAQSAAVAIAQGHDGAAAARAAVPGWARGGIEVRTTATGVRVTLTPPSLLPGLGSRLRATATADAGGAS